MVGDEVSKKQKCLKVKVEKIVEVVIKLNVVAWSQ